ncbi:hypothetical protein [Actinomadura parmotrematis]|uniref:Lipoprotein n=1 Tax=Actinomadura parmotrematis TaxID=2864039 RepID=A0ABS7FRJ3_9ACTN|nr:hypothetical protein [Actinomadura parmotrematis]MBW8482153.1 hypothetical protein [Actinomadura parmotrematis]
MTAHRWLLPFLALIAVLLACLAVVDRGVWGVWSPLSAPEHFQYCGARYYRDDETQPGVTHVVTRAEAERDGRLTEVATVGPRRWKLYRAGSWPCPEPDEHVHETYLGLGGGRYLVMSDAN